MGYSSWGHKELDTTEQLTLSLSICIEPGWQQSKPDREGEPKLPEHLRMDLSTFTPPLLPSFLSRIIDSNLLCGRKQDRQLVLRLYL